MENCKNQNLMAGIFLDSQSIKMKIATVLKKGTFSVIDTLKHPVFLGHDTFTSGKIGVSTLTETCNILKNYQNLLQEYQVGTYRVVATSAIREATNKDYVVDQLRLRTGLQVEVINNSEKRFLTYQALPQLLPNYEDLKKEGLLIMEVGSGSIQITFFANNNLVHSENFTFGPIRITEILADIKGKTTNYLEVLREYITCGLARSEAMSSHITFPNFVVIGGEVQTIARLCTKNQTGTEILEIKRDAFLHLYKLLLDNPSSDQFGEWGTASGNRDVILTTITLIHELLSITNAVTIYTPPVSLEEGIIAGLALSSDKHHVRKQDADIVGAAWYVAGKYHCNLEHVSAVEKLSLQLFDGLSSLHGMGSRQRLLLQIAAILHDTGKFISSTGHYHHSYNIILASGLPGLSTEELHMVATMARYHSSIAPGAGERDFPRMNPQDRLETAKLISLLRIANALDTSHLQKIKLTNIKVDATQMILTLESAEKTFLEELAFGTKAEFFKEVFGLTPGIKLKRKLYNE